MTKKTKIAILIFGIITLIVLTGSLIMAISRFFDNNKLVFHSPVEIAFFQPIKVEERKPEVVKEVIIPDLQSQIDTPLKQYICEKFGALNCKLAIAVFTAESGLREDAININVQRDGTKSIDYGIGQINSVHFKTPGCSLKEITDQFKNVDCSYKIWDRADGKEGNGEGSFSPWVAAKNGNYLSHLK